jgi:hypothetical protein
MSFDCFFYLFNNIGHLEDFFWYEIKKYFSVMWDLQLFKKTLEDLPTGCILLQGHTIWIGNITLTGINLQIPLYSIQVSSDSWIFFCNWRAPCYNFSLVWVWQLSVWGHCGTHIAYFTGWLCQNFSEKSFLLLHS